MHILTEADGLMLQLFDYTNELLSVLPNLLLFRFVHVVDSLQETMQIPPAGLYAHTISPTNF